MRELEVRKRLLIAESEVYRQTLRLDVQNLRLYSFQMRRKWAGYAALKPLFLAGFPLASALFSRRREGRRPRSMLSNLIAGWRMYQKLQPFIASMLAQYAAKAQKVTEPTDGQDKSPAQEATAEGLD